MDAAKRKKQIAKQLGIIAGALKRATNENTIRSLEADRQKLKDEWAKLSQQDLQE